MQFIGTVEFYVTLLLAAAIIAGIIAMPSGHGPVETDFSEAFLTFDPELTDLTPRMELECLPDGSVKLTRIGLPDDIDSTATMALSITRKGFDLSAEERITPGARPYLRTESQPVNKATFILSGLAQERYHMRYNSEPTTSFTTLSFVNRPGLRSTRLFRHA